MSLQHLEDFSLWKPQTVEVNNEETLILDYLYGPFILLWAGLIIPLIVFCYEMTFIKIKKELEVNWGF